MPTYEQKGGRLTIRGDLEESNEPNCASTELRGYYQKLTPWSWTGRDVTVDLSGLTAVFEKAAGD